VEDIVMSTNKKNPEIQIESMARQMHQKTVQHYWVYYVNLVDGESALNQTTFLTQAQALYTK